MGKKVFVLGNPLVKSDRRVFYLLRYLKKEFSDINFEFYDPTEEIDIHINSDLIFLDTGINLKKTTLFRDLKYFELSPNNSVHDYDLPLQLGLMKKLGKMKKVYIVAVPAKGKTTKILQEVKAILTTI
ncbi:hypothetical protein HY338_01490 [Candidatus Gottesmanbacteria bacterium]|nr:hypothetical protein [Candidatus Gottesmanbacteria bacterium]